MRGEFRVGGSRLLALERGMLPAAGGSRTSGPVAPLQSIPKVAPHDLELFLEYGLGGVLYTQSGRASFTAHGELRSPIGQLA